MDGNQFLIPTDEEVIAIEVGAADLRGHWDISLLGEDNTIDILLKDIVFSSLLKPGSYLKVRNTFHLADISRMQTRIPSDDDISLDMFSYWLQREVIHHATIQFSFLKNVPFVNYLS